MTDDLDRLLEQSAERFRMSSEVPARLVRRIAVRRAVAAGVLTVVLVGAGTGAVFGISALEGRDANPPVANEDADDIVAGDVPDVARVLCTEDGATAVTPQVRPRDDGIHIEIDNRTDKRMFYIRDAELSDGNQGGGLKPHAIEKVVSTLPPGMILVGCFENDRTTPYSEVAGQGFAELTIVDPESKWVPVEPSCAIPERMEWDVRVEDAPENPDYVEMARAHIDSLDEEDQLLPAGYRDTPWHSAALLTVMRDDDAIASLSFWPGTGYMTISVQTCSEGGLEAPEDSDPEPVGDSNAWQFYTDTEDGYSIGYPETWYRAEESLTLKLHDPKELVSLATYELTYRDTGCDHLPGSALEDLAADDAFVSIQERVGDVTDYPPRPEDFETSAEPVGGFMCTPEGVEVYWMSFRDAGRGFYALLALGSQVSQATRDEAWEVLNSFEPSTGDRHG